MKILALDIERVSKDIADKWRHKSMVRKSMAEYKRLHPACEWSGRVRFVQTHHIYPVSVAPMLAGLHTNMVRLTRGAHLHLAHFGDFKTSFLPNIREVIDVAQRQNTIEAES